MAIFTITSFTTFADLLLAGQKLASDPGPLNRLKALADLATNTKSLTAILRETNLTALAAEMTRVAEETAEHFTHDARALFWQVAPAAFSDPCLFATTDLDPTAATDRMIQAIRTSPHARDFFATGLPESLFRQVAHRTLTTMLARADYIASITPTLWRDTLRSNGIQLELLTTIDDTTRRTEAKLDALRRELLAPGLPLSAAKAILVEFGQTDVPDDFATIERLLRAAAEQYRLLQERLREFDNSSDLAVGALLRDARSLIEAGRFDEADAKLIEAEHHADLARARVRANRGDLARLRLRYREAANHFAAAAGMVPPEAAELRRVYEMWRAYALQALGTEFGDNDALREAIDLLRLILLQTPRAEAPLDWAMAQHNLCAVLQTLGGREVGARRLEEAVEACGAALEERTRDRVPLDWAATQSNLGAALQTLGARETGTERLERAVAAYRAALEEQTRDRVPLDWATTQNDLGNALLTLGEREAGTERLEEAVAAYRAALGELTRERAPFGWSLTQSNLGNALATLGGREPSTARLEEAVTAYRDALQERTRARMPFDWAGIQNNLGTALSALGEREAGTARLEEAVIAFRAALEERTRDRAPLDWAMTQMNLGNALRALGLRGQGEAHLGEAVAAYRAALQERTRARVPLDWAMTQSNLGDALRALGERELGTLRLEEAVGAYRAAREEMTCARMPLGWAINQTKLAIALVVLADRTDQSHDAALAEIDAALAVFRASGAGGYVEWAEGIRRRIAK